MKRRRGAAAELSCLQAWAAESQALAGRWRVARCSRPGPGRAAEREARQQRDGFGELLRRMWVLEACGACGQDLSTEELWQKVLQEVTARELQAPLHRLGALQAAWWLAASRLGSIAGLFRLLSNAEDPGRACCREGKNELLSLLKAWRVPAEEASLPLVESTENLKEILCTAAAFLQGLQELEAGNFATALSLFREAAGGFCSKRVLAQIYTCLGYCAQQMGKPQTALQHLKRALQVDFQCLPALFHAAAVYRELGETNAELEALALLYEALGKKLPAAASSSPYFLIQTELLVDTPILASLLRRRHPSEVKYLLAQRCLQDGRVADAVEHYLDFLALLQEGLQQQVPLDDSSALPRIPEVILETASALEQAGRHQDAITMCDEVISRTTDLIPRMLRVERPSPGAGLVGGLLSQKKESLYYLAWRAAGYLHQGWAWAKLGESKEAITKFSRCLGDLLQLQLYGSGVEPTENLLPDVEVLQKIRLLSLIGRGMQFLDLGRHKEALLDFQYSLQISPGDPAAASYLVLALWKLNRKQEAAAYWQKFSKPPPGEDGQQEGQGRSFPLYLVSCLKQAMFPHSESLARTIQDYLATTRWDPSS
ncbi:Fanconi anemia group G protein isoform X2 [Harpia harpyja]|uniref:Fanconi anemia group G protein isoform X2 n=1 Tax=Harpia harpyja TaxID=202280 RepID=UPI0022B1CE3A|nr:Fanconi anemia group G protein isoform X2 [Harpia harpyja]